MKLSVIVGVITIFVFGFWVFFLTRDFILTVVIGGLCGVLLALKERRAQNSENGYEYDSIGIRNKIVPIIFLLLVLTVPTGVFFFVTNDRTQTWTEEPGISDTIYISMRSGLRYAVMFDGETRDGYAHGMGVARFEGGYTFEGEFAYDSVVSGLLTFFDGMTFEGEFYNRQFHYGTRTHPNGQIYIGSFYNNLSGGQGRLYFPNGQVHVGEFSNSQPNGHGTRYWPDGHVFVGGFRDSQPHGHGRVYFPNGNTHEGAVYNGQPHGHGTFTWVNGDVYIGEFYNGPRHGHGTFTYANGDVYVGEFYNSERHGYGRFYVGGNLSVSGIWERGEFIGSR